MQQTDIIDGEVVETSLSQVSTSDPNACYALATQINDAIPVQYRDPQSTANLMTGAAQGNIGYLQQMKGWVESQYGVTVYAGPVTNNYQIHVQVDNSTHHHDNRQWKDSYNRTRTKTRTGEAGEANQTVLACVCLFLLLAGLGLLGGSD